MTSNQHIAIVGAGLAGLSAAARLASCDRSVTVFEARDRVGGRVWSDRLRGRNISAVIERGAEFVLGDYDVFTQLVHRYELELIDTGMSYYVRDVIETPHVTTDDIALAGKRAAKIAEDLPASTTVGEVLDLLQVPAEVTDALRSRVEISTAVEVSDSAASALNHAASFEKLPSWRVGGGNQSLPNSMAEALPNGVRLGQRVRAIHSSENQVHIYTEDSDESFDAVIVAVPLEILRKQTDFRISIPSWKQEALDRLMQGHAAKIHIPLANVSRTSATMSVPGRFWNWTARNETGAITPVLNGFMGTRKSIEAFELRDGPQKWELAVRQSRPELEYADSAGHAVLTNWISDPLALGAYTTPSPKSLTSDWNTLEFPVGPVYFAGEYADPEFAGLMEGAIRSGQRAAERVIRGVEELSPDEFSRPN